MMNELINEKRQPAIRTCHVVNVVDPKLAARINNYQMRIGVARAGYPVLTDWHPVNPEGWGEFPRPPVERSVVHRGNAESWAYSHHASIAKLGERYMVTWSNGFRHEDYVGQVVRGAWSATGRDWSEPVVIAPTPVESNLVRNNVGLCVADGRLYCFVGVAHDFGRDAKPRTDTVEEQRIRLDVYETEDLVNWTQHESVCENVYLFQGPRPTRGGKYICCGHDLRDHHAVVLIWDDASRLTEAPRVIDLPLSPEGVLPSQGTWYQTDDGRIWMYFRDASISLCLGLTWSDDEGETWSETLRSDFPNSFSRACAGRLDDGRCYIAGNNYNRFVDRMSLMIALSDNGYTFDRQYVLVDGDTTRRIDGHHKENGYHYPNCLSDGDKLLVTYSVNKEDIEVGIADMSKVT